MATLSRQTLNRTLLHRQGLLEPWDCPPTQVVQRLSGLQAQAPLAPYYGVFSRLGRYDPDVLGHALERREVIRLSLMRSTLQLATADDALAFRAVLARQHIQVLPKPLRESPVFAEVIVVAKALIEEEPRTFAELGAALHARFDQHRPDDLCRMARGGLALVQVPPRGVWGQTGPSRHAILQTWLGAELPEPDVEAFVARYLSAFGPASAADVAAWSGLTGLARVLDRMDLVRHRSEDGRLLFDEPSGELIDEASAAPVRVLAEFDNVLLAHADRSRIFDDEDRLRFMTQNGLIAATLLIDGFVCGHCKRTRTGLDVFPYRRLTATVRRAVVAEAEQLLEFAAPGQKAEVTVQPV